MKLTMSVIAIFLIAASPLISCSHPQPNNSSPINRPSSASSPIDSGAGGGSMAKEPGDTASEEFEGTAGMTEVKRQNATPSILKAIRTGRHSNFDRVVFEFEGNQIPGYHTEYI